MSDRARKVMQLAQEEARCFKTEYVGTEHILLGLIKEDSGVHAHVLMHLGLDPGKIRLEVEKLMNTGSDRVIVGKLPQTPRARKVVEYAIEEARNFNHNYVGTDHLLLGLLREEDGIAGQVLVRLGMKVETVRATVLYTLNNEELMQRLQEGMYFLIPPTTSPDPSITPQETLLQNLSDLAKGFEISSILVMGTKKTSSSS